ncbi:MAG TPA: hypothetical protein VNZ52_08530 [Candidatus Thermoplasmatota archaeon]|nr:hypothetical protein [Candidatus Thermoplasmatota archaeon]
MNRRICASVATLMLLLAPTVLATHQKDQGPPASTTGYIGGLYAEVLLGVEPVEINFDGSLANEDLPGQQRLQTVSTYNCLTGEPATGPSASKYSFDVVAMNNLNAGGVNGINTDDHIVNSLLVTLDGRAGTGMGDNKTTSSTVTYAGRAYLGYGDSHPATIFPGRLRFFANVICGGQTAEVLPAATGRQTPGIFAYHDENRWGPLGGQGNEWSPEFTFSYLAPAKDARGILLPGDLRTPGWYLTTELIWIPNLNLQSNTFRFVVNPSFVDAYPGYAGSRYAGVQRFCITDDSPQTDPETGGLFGNCDNTGAYFFQDYFYPPVAPASVDSPAPTLEDVDVVAMPDRALTGANVLEPAYLEVNAAARFARNAATAMVPTIEAPFEMEPNTALGETPVKAVGGGWSAYLDVQKVTSLGVAIVALDPLYSNGFSERRDAYPTFVNFRAYLGLAKDANGDGVIAFGNRAEWFGIDDRLVRSSNGSAIKNWADVGSIEVGGNDLLTSEAVIAVDYCTTVPGVTPYNAGDRIPIGNADVARCNNARGDAANGWGTFIGGDSSAGTGAYGTRPDFFSAGGSTSGEWRTSVMARIQWPTVAEFTASGLTLPAGVSISTLAGTTTFLKDVDVYGPTLA